MHVANTCPHRTLTTIVAIRTRTQCANISIVWTSSLPIWGMRSSGIEALSNLAPQLKQLHMLALWDVTAMPAIATLTMTENYIKTNSIRLQGQAECRYEREEYHNQNAAPFSLYLRSTTVSCYISDQKNRGQKTPGKQPSDGALCLRGGGGGKWAATRMQPNRGTMPSGKRVRRHLDRSAFSDWPRYGRWAKGDAQRCGTCAVHSSYELQMWHVCGNLRCMCSASAVHVQCICGACAVHVLYMCSTRAVHAQYTCCTCAALAKAPQSGAQNGDSHRSHKGRQGSAPEETVPPREGPKRCAR